MIDLQSSLTKYKDLSILKFVVLWIHMSSLMYWIMKNDHLAEKLY